MAAPEKATPRWHGADAANQSKQALILPQADAERKAFATAQAEAAMAGCTLHRTDDGRYLVGRLNLCREVPSIADVRELLARIGGQGHD